MQWIQPVILDGERIMLMPLDFQHTDALCDAVREGELWKLWYTKIPAPENMHSEIQRRFELQKAGKMLPFTVIERNSGRVLGMTSLMNIEVEHRRVEIGSTWYRLSAQRSYVNTECKHLLLKHAFEVLKCIAVEFRTSSFNFKSRTAIERLGAKLDGVLRNHQIVEGDILRDTYIYSILQSEWSAVKQNLVWKLEQP